ncbi:MAG: c-type cytochrome [Methylococcaceae bacterium]|nr:c-type cytochrome [Methylococcaceae bacterium]
MSACKKIVVGAFVSGALLFGATVPAFAAAKVDKDTFDGWKLYKRERCETCHGPTAEGAAAFPNLVNSLKNIDKAKFVDVVTNGTAKGMPAHKANAKVMDGMEKLYKFVKGRSDGTVPAGELEAGE